MGFDRVFTVFTPAYNRAHTLPRVYQSLAAQTFRDFEWLIVDDGSTDGTAELVAAWRGEAAFPIRYLRQENQGKHVAFNRGVELARGELFLTLDSDDACLPQALERLLFHWRDIPAGERARFAGVTARCQDQEGRPLGRPLPAPVMDLSALELRHGHRYQGELWGFTRTQVLRAFPYPEPPGARFLPEDLVWSPIAARYLTRFVDEPLRVYFTEGGDRLTGSGVPASHLTGLMLWHQMVLNLEIPWLARHPAYFWRSAVNYARFSRGLGLGLGQQWQGLSNARARALWLLGLLPGWLLAGRDGRRR
ncbi:MAG: glycosyltransferase family 2 protein [Desulfarculus sp.]|nr:glycosyltransferase family 2 protein [Desulfarculus sp.]